MLLPALLVGWAGLVAGVTLSVAARGRECLRLRLAELETLSGSFEVVSAGSPHVRAWAEAAGTKERVLNFEKTEKARWAISTANGDDTYNFCFENLESHPVYVGFGYHSSRVPEADVTTDKDTTQLVQMAEKLLGRVVEMDRQQSLAIRREANQREAAERAAKSAAWWTAVKALFVVALAAAQIFYLRSFFEVKQIV